MHGGIIQGHAISIEHSMSRYYGYDRFGLGGFVNSDHIRRNGFIHSLIVLLGEQYKIGKNQKEIDDFIDDILYYSSKSMDDIENEALGEIERILEKFESLV